MALLVVRFSQNVMKNYSIWFETERETIISSYSDFTKIAPTVPLYLEANISSYLLNKVLTKSTITQL